MLGKRWRRHCCNWGFFFFYRGFGPTLRTPSTSLPSHHSTPNCGIASRPGRSMSLAQRVTHDFFSFNKIKKIPALSAPAGLVQIGPVWSTTGKKKQIKRHRNTLLVPVYHFESSKRGFFSGGYGYRHCHLWHWRLRKLRAS